MPSARFGPNAVSSMSRVSSSGCETAFSMRRKRAGRVAYAALAGLRTARDAAGRLVDAVDVVDAADVQHADGFGQQVRREVDAGRAIENDRRHDARRARDDFGIDEAFLRHDDRLLRVLAHVVDVDAEQRRRFHRVRIRSGDRWCTARCACPRAGGTATS